MFTKWNDSLTEIKPSNQNRLPALGSHFDLPIFPSASKRFMMLNSRKFEEANMVH